MTSLICRFGNDFVNVSDENLGYCGLGNNLVNVRVRS